MHKSFKVDKNHLDLFMNRNPSIFDKFSGDSLSYLKKVDEKNLNEIIYQAANGKINGDEIIKAYFPSMSPHIFISHSSRDKSTAIKFANYLFYTYGITSFIDSQIWGHIEHALKILNGKYSKLRTEDDGSITYSHKKANIISSNIYAMLTIALINTMDNSDSLIFLSSENSVGGDSYDIEDILNEKYKTESPWIYSEINFSRMLRPKMHERPSLMAYDGSEGFVAHEKRGQISLEEHASFSFSTEMDHMIKVSFDSLSSIKNIHRKNHSLLNLDDIYHVLEAKTLF